MDNRGKLIVNFVYTILSLVLLATVLSFSIVTRCWFSANDTVAVTGQITVAAPDLSNVEIASYPVTAISGTSYTYTTAETLLELPTYDPSQILVSQYEKALMLVVTFRSSSTSPVNLTLKSTHPEVPVLSESAATVNYLSNCVQFRAGTLSSGTTVSAGTAQSFLTVGMDGTLSKTAGISFTFNNVTVGENVCYVLMEYNPSLLGLFFDYLSINPSESMETEYLDDLIFDIGEGASL